MSPTEITAIAIVSVLLSGIGFAAGNWRRKRRGSKGSKPLPPTAPFVEFPAMENMSDRQLLTLLLYELIEAKAELRAVAHLIVELDETDASWERFDRLVNTVQAEITEEMKAHAQQLMRPPQRPPLN